MYLPVQLGLFGMFLLLSSSVALNVFDACDEDGPSCPFGSRCMWRGCDGKKCICESNFLPSLNKTSCVKETPLGEKCKIGSMCVGQPLSECRLNTNCSCLEGYKPSVNGTYCVLIMKGGDAAVEYGQYCNNIKQWCFPDDLLCSNNRCVCEPGFRPATKEERYAEPYNTRYCRPKSFQLGVPVNINGAECKKPEASTTTHTVALTTSSIPIPSVPSTSTQSTESSTQIPSTSYSTLQSISTAITEKTTSSTAKLTTTISTEPSSVASTSSKATQSTSKETTTTKLTTSTKTVTTSVPSTTTRTTTTSTTATTSSRPTTSDMISTTTATTQVPTTNPSSSSTTLVTIPNTVQTKTVISTQPNFTTLSTSEKIDTSTEMTERISTKISTSKSYTVSGTSTKSTSMKTPNQSNNSVPSAMTSVKTPSKPAVASSSTTAAASTTVGIGDKCHNKKCQNNSECVTDACNDDRCRCKLGYANSPDSKSCWKLSALGEECGSERICQGQKTQCGDKGVCECEDGYERSDSGRWCRLKTSWFVDFPVIGEECSGGFFSQCYMQFEQHCVNGKCQCKEGFREIVDRLDMNAVYPDKVQCRNDSIVIGVREEMLCLHQSRESREYNMYDRAKSKIRKIQGAIIGGCVGFVAMLGIVIGVVALVRWKRRGRREPIRDSSSTASTDATSRYSFKIPRPFTHFVGAKEYDSTQISYPNTVFDREEDTTVSEPTPDVVNVGTLARLNQNMQPSAS